MVNEKFRCSFFFNVLNPVQNKKTIYNSKLDSSDPCSKYTPALHLLSVSHGEPHLRLSVRFMRKGRKRKKVTRFTKVHWTSQRRRVPIRDKLNWWVPWRLRRAICQCG